MANNVLAGGSRGSNSSAGGVRSARSYTSIDTYPDLHTCPIPHLYGNLSRSLYYDDKIALAKVP